MMIGRKMNKVRKEENQVCRSIKERNRTLESGRDEIRTKTIDVLLDTRKGGEDELNWVRKKRVGVRKVATINGEEVVKALQMVNRSRLNK